MDDSTLPMQTVTGYRPSATGSVDYGGSGGQNQLVDVIYSNSYSCWTPEECAALYAAEQASALPAPLINPIPILEPAPPIEIFTPTAPANEPTLLPEVVVSTAARVITALGGLLWPSSIGKEPDVSQVYLPQIVQLPNPVPASAPAPTVEVEPDLLDEVVITAPSAPRKPSWLATPTLPFFDPILLPTMPFFAPMIADPSPSISTSPQPRSSPWPELQPDYAPLPEASPRNSPSPSVPPSVPPSFAVPPSTPYIGDFPPFSTPPSTRPIANPKPGLDTLLSPWSNFEVDPGAFPMPSLDADADKDKCKQKVETRSVCYVKLVKERRNSSQDSTRKWRKIKCQ